MWDSDSHDSCHRGLDSQASFEYSESSLPFASVPFASRSLGCGTLMTHMPHMTHMTHMTHVTEHSHDSCHRGLDSQDSFEYSESSVPFASRSLGCGTLMTLMTHD